MCYSHTQVSEDNEWRVFCNTDENNMTWCEDLSICLPVCCCDSSTCDKMSHLIRVSRPHSRCESLFRLVTDLWSQYSLVDRICFVCDTTTNVTKIENIVVRVSIFRGTFPYLILYGNMIRHRILNPGKYRWAFGKYWFKVCEVLSSTPGSVTSV